MPISMAEYHGFCEKGLTKNLSTLSEMEVRAVLAPLEQFIHFGKSSILLFVARPAGLKRYQRIEQIPQDKRDTYGVRTSTVPAAARVGADLENITLSYKSGMTVWRIHVGPTYKSNPRGDGLKAVILYLRITKDVDDYFWVHYVLSKGSPVFLKCDQLSALIALMRQISSGLEIGQGFNTNIIETNNWIMDHVYNFDCFIEHATQK